MKERIKAFWSERDNLTTSIGKSIYNILIANNVDFKEIVVEDETIQQIVPFEDR